MNRKFVWCWFFEDGTISPIGDAKSYEYAMSVSQSMYPKKFKLFELIEVKEPPKG